MVTEGVPWLRTIKDGTIANSLKPFSEIDNLIKEQNRRDCLHRMIEFNRWGRFPKYSNLLEKIKCHTDTIYRYVQDLKKLGVAFNVSMLELKEVFSYRKHYNICLPKSLEHATWGDLSKRKIHPSGPEPRGKRVDSLRPPNWPLYNLALVEEGGIPVWVDAFRFLKRYKVMPKI